MSLFYRLAYAAGFAPWEKAARHGPAAGQIAALLDREQEERRLPLGRALDLGCGTGYWAVELTRRGWSVTGIDLVGSAVQAARDRARSAGVAVRLVRGDVTALRDYGVEPAFDFFWDFGMLHGLAPEQQTGAGREIDAVAAPGATLLMLAWRPGWRGPLPHGMSASDIDAVFPDWRVIDTIPFDATGLPPPLRTVEPRVYRLRRSGS
ncbi:MAG: class I SAM-dependent methyltransferase [Hyphomicrobiaceae bacterium]